MTVRTPWSWGRARADGGDGEHLGMVSYFRLKGLRALPAFALNTLRIESQLRRTPGLVGHSGGARLSRLEFWSVSVWRDEEALQRYVRALPHREIMGAMNPHVARAEFVRWRCPGRDVPPDPREAEERLRRALAAGDADPAA